MNGLREILDAALAASPPPLRNAPTAPSPTEQLAAMVIPQLENPAIVHDANMRTIVALIRTLTAAGMTFDQANEAINSVPATLTPLLWSADGLAVIGNWALTRAGMGPATPIHIAVH